MELVIDCVRQNYNEIFKKENSLYHHHSSAISRSCFIWWNFLAERLGNIPEMPLSVDSTDKGNVPVAVSLARNLKIP